MLNSKFQIHNHSRKHSRNGSAGGMLGGATLFVLLSFALTHAAAAAPITYTVVSPSSSLDFVGIEDALDPTNLTPCPPSVSSCLAAPVSITSASVTFDSETAVLSNLTIRLDGTGILNMGGLNNYETIAFTGTTFQSSLPTVLTVDTPGPPLTTYETASVIGGVTIDNIDLTMTGGSTVSLPYANPAVPGVAIRIGLNAAGDLTLGLQGVEIGYFTDALGQNPLSVKADFDLVVSAVPVPEPGAAALFGMGIGSISLALRRRSGAER